MNSLVQVIEGNPFVADQPVFQGDFSDLLQAMEKLRLDKQSHLVVTANVDHLVDLNLGTSLLESYQAASIRTIDGAPLLWLYKLLGARNVSRLTGADLLMRVASESKERGWKVVITGGMNDVLFRAVNGLQLSFPGSDISGVSMPMLDTIDDTKSLEVVGWLNQHRPDIVFLCMGAPKQENWYLHWKSELPPAVFVGAGAAVDFAAGTKKRAPKFAQRIGLEWCWRMTQEFRRLAPRYLLKAPKFLLIAAGALRHRSKTK